MIVGLYLKKCRKKAGKTQNEIARKLGYGTPQFLSNVERGLCMPARSSVRKWCDLIDANPEIIFALWIDQTAKTLRKSLKIKQKKGAK